MMKLGVNMFGDITDLWFIINVHQNSSFNGL